MTDPIRVLSFGAGVQSSYVARMSLLGEIPPFDHVIFADTGDEPADVYTNLRWWSDRFEQAGVPFHVVRRPVGIAEATLSTRRTLTPLFLQAEDGSRGILGRKCTRDWKVAQIQGRVRELVGVAGRRHNHITDHLVTQTLGISWDEAHRMRDPQYTWMRHDYPLVDRRITRWDCIAEMGEDPDYPDPPRSACFHCPYHSDREWRRLRDEQPEAWDRAVEFDRAIRVPGALDHLRGTPFLHSSLKPLDEVDLSTEEDRGQGTLWGQECEGMCGL